MKIYLAGPYGRRAGLSEDECEVNTLQAIEWARFMIGRGHIPFVPHLYHWVHKGWGSTPTEGEWFVICSEWIKDCEAIFMLPGWEKSWGASAELGIAHGLGKQVYFHNDPLHIPVLKRRTV